MTEWLVVIGGGKGASGQSIVHAFEPTRLQSVCGLGSRMYRETRRPKIVDSRCLPCRNIEASKAEVRFP